MANTIPLPLPNGSCKSYASLADVVKGNQVVTDISVLIPQVKKQALENVIKDRPSKLEHAKNMLKLERKHRDDVKEFESKRLNGYFSDLGYISDKYHDEDGNLINIDEKEYERLKKLVQEYEDGEDLTRDSDCRRHGASDKYTGGCSCEPEYIWQHDCGDDEPPNCSLFYHPTKRGGRQLVCSTMCGECDKKTSFCECKDPYWIEIKARYEFAQLARDHPVLKRYPALCYVKPDKQLEYYD